DYTEAAEAQLVDVAVADGPGDSGRESSADASVDASDADGGCAPPLRVRVAGGTGLAYFTISSDGSQCSVETSAAGAVLVYMDEGMGAGDLPAGAVWVPTGSPWHILTQDGGLWGQGISNPNTLECNPSLVLQYAFRLKDNVGDTLSVSVGCGFGDVFVVYSVSFTSGGALVDASAE
ncbi:MAG: hypothetical protein ACREJ3_00510, partial [Polyangiaceae bacterium]